MTGSRGGDVCLESIQSLPARLRAFLQFIELGTHTRERVGVDPLHFLVVDSLRLRGRQAQQPADAVQPNAFGFAARKINRHGTKH